MAGDWLIGSLRGAAVYNAVCNLSVSAASLGLTPLCSHRKVFFTDYGQIPKVERCDMDGQNRTKLVDSKIVFPHGITLDLVSRLVYWADAYLDYIEVVDYEGRNRHTIIQGLLVRMAHGTAGCRYRICPGERNVSGLLRQLF